MRDAAVVAKVADRVAEAPEVAVVRGGQRTGRLMVPALAVVPAVEVVLPAVVLAVEVVVPAVPGAGLAVVPVVPVVGLIRP